MKERNVSYDLLRFIGILCVMIAHSGPPDWLFQIRNFGTPLLVVVSALTYSTIYKERDIPVNFLKKRLTRLIIPTWIFLVFFFLFFLAVSVLIGKDYPFTGREIFFTYLFFDGIGFVWIFKIYIILALITPITLRINKRKTKLWKYNFWLILIYILYEIIVKATADIIPSNSKHFFNLVVFIVIPYTLLYFYGMRLAELAKKQIILIGSVSLIIFIVMAVYFIKDTGTFVQTQTFKNPPRLYYLSFAFFAINILFLLSSYVVKFLNKDLIFWLSSNSLWIYLWHILAFYLCKYAFNMPEKDLLSSVFKVTLFLGFGILMTFIQKRIIKIYTGDNEKRLSLGIVKILS